MKTLTIDLDNLSKSNLDISLYVSMQLIYEGYNDWKNTSYDTYHILENRGYIKILNLEEYEFEPRDKLIQLFEKSEKNTEAIEILNYLNLKIKSKAPTKRGFDIRSKSNLKFVNARLKSGYTKDDLTRVIDKKFKDWWGTNMQSYLRPETLFNETKFQGYINEVGEDTTNTYNPIELC